MYAAKIACGTGLVSFGGALYYIYKETLISKLQPIVDEVKVDK